MIVSQNPHLNKILDVHPLIQNFTFILIALGKVSKKKTIESLTAVKPEGGGGGVSGLVVIVLRFFFVMLQTYVCGLRKPQNIFCGHSKLHIAYLFKVI